MGVEGNPRISEEKGLFPPFSGFSRCSSGPPEKGDKGRKRAKKADFGRFSGKGSHTPLKPPFVAPPFAAAQDTCARPNGVAILLLVRSVFPCACLLSCLNPHTYRRNIKFYSQHLDF